MDYTRKKTHARQSLARAKHLLGKRKFSLYKTIGHSYGPTGYSTGRKELKFIDTEISNSTITTTGSVTLLNGVSQGTDFNDRIGRKIVLKSMIWNAAVFSNNTGAPNGDIIRLLVVYDTQTNSASAPSVTDILAVADPTSPMNLNNRDRFHVLKDLKLQSAPSTYTASAITAGAPQNIYEPCYKKLSKDVIFSGTGATVGSIQTGAIWLLQISLLSDAIDHTSYFRWRFLDS